MSDKYQNKYRIPSARLQNWNYGANGSYFITICTQHKEHFFGEIIELDGVPTMQLNEIGKLAEDFWLKIPVLFPFIELGNFVVMPNHMHGILLIDKNENLPDRTVETLHCNVSTPRNISDATDETKRDAKTLHCNVSTDKTKNEQMAKISPKSGSVSTILRSYKSEVTKRARFIHADFGWQTRFHDHIIRNAESFERIQYYIVNNPLKWKEDKFYP